MEPARRGFRGRPRPRPLQAAAGLRRAPSRQRASCARARAARPAPAAPRGADDRPARPAAPPTLPPAFDGGTATALTVELTRDNASRVPGSLGAARAADWFRDKLALYGIGVEEDRWREHVPGVGTVELRNLAAVVEGTLDETIVFVAHRDNTGRSAGANDNASGTAALVELARAYATAGTTASAADAAPHARLPLDRRGLLRLPRGCALRRRLAARAPCRRDRLARRHRRDCADPRRAERPRPPVARRRRSSAPSWCASAPRPARSRGSPGFLTQLVSLALPFGFGEQAPALASGIPAVRLTTSPDGGVSGGADELEGLSARTARAARPGLGDDPRLARRLRRAARRERRRALPRRPRRPRLGARADPADSGSRRSSRRRSTSSHALPRGGGSDCGRHGVAPAPGRAVARPHAAPRARRGRRRPPDRAAAAAAAGRAAGRRLARRSRRGRDRRGALVWLRAAARLVPTRPRDAGGRARGVRRRVPRPRRRRCRDRARLALRAPLRPALAVRVAAAAAAPPCAGLGDRRRLRARLPRARPRARRPRGAARPRAARAALRRLADDDGRRPLDGDALPRGVGRGRGARRRRCRRRLREPAASSGR